MSSIDIDKLAAILRDAAIAEIMPRFRRLDAGMIRTKSSAVDLVTDADVQAEWFIKARVAELAPDALFIGEESVAAEPELLDRLESAQLAVVVDPVDGTANFAAGLPLFAVMASVVRRDETIAGIIYDPVGDDWFAAEKGAGAYICRPDGSRQRTTVSEPVALGDMVGTISMGFLDKVAKPKILANLAKVRIPANFRVAGHDYRLLAGGQTHFATFNKLMPWDHLAGALIIQEAGGYVARFDGSPYLPHHRAGGLLATTDIDSWQTFHREVLAV